MARRRTRRCVFMGGDRGRLAGEARAVAGQRLSGRGCVGAVLLCRGTATVPAPGAPRAAPCAVPWTRAWREDSRLGHFANAVAVPAGAAARKSATQRQPFCPENAGGAGGRHRSEWSTDGAGCRQRGGGAAKPFGLHCWAWNPRQFTREASRCGLKARITRCGCTRRGKWAVSDVDARGGCRRSVGASRTNFPQHETEDFCRWQRGDHGA